MKIIPSITEQMLKEEISFGFKKPYMGEKVVEEYRKLIEKYNPLDYNAIDDFISYLIKTNKLNSFYKELLEFKKKNSLEIENYNQNQP